ncbi:hypothetical protein BHM03_00034834 [Ensete ventricosum]|nr:hypothetical protein BHM03_00034834 [Ensete ventricosum]
MAWYVPYQWSVGVPVQTSKANHGYNSMTLMIWFAISGGTARCPRAISSFGAGRRHVSPRGEKERGDVALVTFIEWYRGILTHTELYPRFAILTFTARYGRYIPVCQVAGTRTARYRVVPPKFDRQRSIEGRNRPSAVD